MKYKFTASIVLFNHKINDLITIIKIFNKSEIHCKLFLIDNSATKLTIPKENRKNLEYIFTGENLGYGKGQNLVLNDIWKHSEIHFLLSPDMKIKKNFLIDSINFLSENTYSVICPKIYYFDNTVQKSIKNFPKPINLFIRSLPFPKFIKNYFNKHYELNEKLFNNLQPVSFASGACLIVKTNVFKEIGIFDEQFFMYMEDVDLCKRINKKFQIIYNPKLYVLHKHTAFSKKRIKFWIIHSISAIRYFNKWGW